MDNVFDMKDFIGTSQGDKAHMLGKFLYFSLSSLLIDREALKKLCSRFRSLSEADRRSVMSFMEFLIEENHLKE